MSKEKDRRISIDIIIESKDRYLLNSIFTAILPESKDPMINIRLNNGKIVINLQTNKFSRIRALYTSIFRLLLVLNGLISTLKQPIKNESDDF